MKLKLATKFSILIISVIALAVISSCVALFNCWQNQRLWLDVVNQHFNSVRQAQELEISLLEQRGFVKAFILDGGDRRWLEEMERREPQFRQSLQRMRASAHTPKEQEILRQLGDLFEQYDRQRDQTIELFDRGEADAARYQLLTQTDESYQKAYELCDEFLRANDKFVSAAILQSGRQVEAMTWVIGASFVVTFVLSGLLAAFFYRDIVRPLRRMVADVQDFSGEASTPAAGASGDDELAMVGRYLRVLMSDVADTRSTLRRSQQLLVDAEKLVSVGKLAACVAHEIRNPLTAVKMWLYSVRKSVAHDAEVSRKLKLVSEEISHLERIVQNFLEFSRPTELRLRSTNVATQVEKALELLAPRFREKSIDVEHRRLLPRLVAAGGGPNGFSANGSHGEEPPGDEWPSVTADSEQIKRVFVNLLLNAVDAVEPCGRVTIEAEATRLGERPWLVVRVSDTGNGMDAEVQAHIFEPFYTTKNEGTGLGLCIAAQVMAQHGGRLVLESSSGHGSRFAVWIPCETNQP